MVKLLLASKTKGKNMHPRPGPDLMDSQSVSIMDGNSKVSINASAGTVANRRVHFTQICVIKQHLTV